jgi:hypothetical protein
MGQFSVEKSVAPGSVLSGNQQKSLWTARRVSSCPVLSLTTSVKFDPYLSQTVFVTQQKSRREAQSVNMSCEALSRNSRHFAAMAPFVSRARSPKLDPFPPGPYDRFMPLTE